MSLPPPLPDPARIETRLLVVAEMLKRAEAEVRRTMVEIEGSTASGPDAHPPEGTVMIDPRAGTPHGTPTTVAGLHDSLTEVVAQSQALRLDVHGAEEARRRANRINLGVLGVLVLLVAVLIAIAIQNNAVARDVRATNQRMADCTTPGGRCYEEGRKRTENAVGAVVRISVYVAECGRLHPGESGPDFDRKLEQCVAERLKTAGP